MNTNQISFDQEALRLVTIDQAWHYKVIPKTFNNGSLELYASSLKISDSLKEELELLLGFEIKLEELEHSIIIEYLNLHYKNQSKDQKLGNSRIENDDFVYQLIKEANQSGSSDIHVESYENKCRIRIRIDGRLIEKYSLKPEEYPGLVNKLKIKANLDISEKRLPQDGRISFKTEYENFDIRISILPTLYGEKVVMRLLSKDAEDINIEKLGFSEKQLRDYLDAVRQLHGIVLISGPTGSGKTTTLYATLKEINTPETNILTIEDPVEYTLPGINQVQLNDAIGLSFAKALKSFLRQDPDVIMLGEIRDEETAKMAIRAALTGHLVLSTIHTNSAWGTISRLIDMGIPPYLLSDTINITAAQRLVRVLCNSCKSSKELSPTDLPSSFSAPFKISKTYYPGKCDHCNYTGYIGRKALYEVIPIKGQFLNAIKDRDNNVKTFLKEQNINTLFDEAFSMLAKGETSLEEVYSLLMVSN